MAGDYGDKLQRIEEKLDALLRQSSGATPRLVNELRTQVAQSAYDTGEVPVTPFAGFPRPVGATGEFLRIVMVNDVYKLANYPPLAQLLRTVKATQSLLSCKVVCLNNGDFLSPCLETSLDGGKAMGEILDLVPFDYVCFGNHEFDIGVDGLQKRTRNFKGKWLNGNISKPQFFGSDGKELPAYEILEVGARKVCLTGVTTDNLDIYRPGTNPIIEKPGEAIAKAFQRAVAEKGDIDAFIPLTHQFVSQDRAMAEELPKLAPALKGKVPVICGGHEHDIFIEDSAGTLIVKVGADAVNAGVIDVWWDASGKVNVACQMLPLAGFRAPVSCPCAAYVKKQQDMLNSILEAEILRLPNATTTLRTRFEPCELASILLTKVKKALDGVEIVLIQGGAVRGKNSYEPGPFTYGGLMKEFAFGMEMAVIELPGAIIAESIKNSRSTPEKEAPNYLHADSECTFDPADAQKLTHIDEKPLDSAKKYKVAIYQFLLGGMNEIEPLLSYVKENVKVPDLELCLPAKGLVMETCMKQMWRKIIGPNTDLKAAFAKMDPNGDGLLSKDEMLAHLKNLAADDDPNNNVSVDLVAQLLQVLDVDGDGKLSFAEIEALAQ